MRLAWIVSVAAIAGAAVTIGLILECRGGRAPDAASSADAGAGSSVDRDALARREREVRVPILLTTIRTLAAAHPVACDQLEAQLTDLVGPSKSVQAALDAVGVSVGDAIVALRPAVEGCHLDIALSPDDVVDPAQASPYGAVVEMVVQAIAGDGSNCKAMRYDVDAVLANNRLTLDRGSLRLLPAAEAARVTTLLDRADVASAACHVDLSPLRH
jgi:hypothetical protein